MSTPLCPDHGTAMLASNRGDGAFFCSKKAMDGTYCRRRYTAAQAQALGRPAPASPPLANAPLGASMDPAGASGGDAVVAAAALKAAAMVFQVQPAWFQTKDSVAQFAIELLNAVRAVL